ncbi:DeoR/GlpR family DNA-binding transcription regulator [Caproiciproducens galactitolivorans]|uniref:Lactose phosphotransferase system repressor n=1 Tax=Caproiciproducens galactitolivorans TaxID=642589 RepID=A0ABT4BSF7_9FIRM|nr:DeoR/GlpR family DNA-binding transcription regulator [Caproiciproducens galactitolivorans]MCY1712871.1 DeoR/GlpR family DNA-binding transcription regulator [Caproiciproducens galactitolivorans]
MFAEERCDKIMAILRAKKHVSLDYLSGQLYCSPATIRRDLIGLENMGLVIRKRGGAALAMGGNWEYSYTFRDMEKKDEKTYICTLAENFLADGLSLFLDSSTTVMNICPVLKKYNNLSVATNGITTALSLIQNDCADTYMAGGHVKYGSTSIVGEQASHFFTQFKADLAIISCRGIDRQGVCEANQQQVMVKKQMMENAESTILLCDSSKFNQSYFFRLSGFKGIDAILTEKKPPEDIARAAAEASCDILFE